MGRSLLFIRYYDLNSAFNNMDIFYSITVNDTKLTYPYYILIKKYTVDETKAFYLLDLSFYSSINL